MYSALLQLGDRFLHVVEVNVRLRRVGDVRDLAILPDEKTDAAGDIFAGHAHAERIGNLAVRVREQREVQIVFLDELPVAFLVVETDTDDFDAVLLQIADGIAEAASLLGATRRVIFRIKVEDDDFLAAGVSEIPGFSFLGFARVAVSKRLATMETAVSDLAFMVWSIGL